MNATTECPQLLQLAAEHLMAAAGHAEATLRPSDSQPVGTRKLPRGYPEATLRLEPLLAAGENT